MKKSTNLVNKNLKKNLYRKTIELTARGKAKVTRNNKAYFRLNKLYPLEKRQLN